MVSAHLLVSQSLWCKITSFMVNCQINSYINYCQSDEFEQRSNGLPSGTFTLPPQTPQRCRPVPYARHPGLSKERSTVKTNACRDVISVRIETFRNCACNILKIRIIPFVFQKAAFQGLKGGVLERKSMPFGGRKVMCWK